ncbi:MAG TPA: tetratricopeptide repeat protein [Alphaproteobacteria bacterium]|nr:tetratricopeptide repeat protein [Alphaproteobacteria bacterium]
MSALLQQAVSAHQSGKLDEAERLYKSVLDSQPHHPDALALLGVVRGSRGDFDGAVGLITRAIEHDPKSALFYVHLGNALMGAKKTPEAMNAFRKAVQLQPGMAEAHYNLANALRASGDWEGAIASYRSAILHNNRYPEAHNNLALALVHEKKYDDALNEAKKAVELAPNYGEGWLTLCNVAEQVKEYQLAADAGAHNVRLLPDSHRAWFGYGVALNRLDRHDEAIAAYKRALQLEPKRADIWDNLGQTYQSLNRLEEAEATFHKTIEAAGQVIAGDGTREIDEKEYGNRHWHLALMELLRGKYPQGFARYRARFKDVGGLKRPDFSRPLWKGESLTGKTILITDEQGYGDTIMLARYLPMIKAQGGKVILSVHPVLKELFENWGGADKVIVHGDTVRGEEYDTYASVFDLPLCFKTTLETIPATVPYLNVLPPNDASKIEPTTKPKGGVVWGGSPLHSNDSRRSVPLALFQKLFGNKDIQFYSFNRDKKKGDEDILPGLPLIDLVPLFKNFAEASRFINQMDLIITVDTATAHLAGSLGKKVWVLLPFAPDWRWLTERSDSPWYPTARLFRQNAPGDWEGVIAQVEAALRQPL